MMYRDPIQDLENDLYDARTIIISLLGAAVEELIERSHNYESFGDFHNWREGTVESIIDSADPREPFEMREYGSLTPRAYCPLCKGSSRNPWGAEGFAHPEGLRRHLLGTYNSVQCHVFSHLSDFARNSLVARIERLKRR